MLSLVQTRPVGGAIIGSLIRDADTDTYVNTEQLPDEDKVRIGVSGTLRGLFQTASPHINLTGDLRLTGHAGLSGASPIASSHLLIQPWGETWSAITTLANLYPYGCNIAAGGGLIGLGGYAIPNILAGASPYIRGLDFKAYVAGEGTPSEVTGTLSSVGTVGYAGTLTDMHAFWAFPAYISLAGGTITRSHGLRISNQGKAGVGTTFGLLIEPQLYSAACYSIWAGATRTGIPRLRLDEGTPGAGQTMIYFAEGIIPTMRRVQWVDPGDGGANLVAGQRVMILV